MKKVLGLMLVLSCCFLSACSLFDKEGPNISITSEDAIYVEVNSVFDPLNYVEVTDNRSDLSDIIISSKIDTSILGEQEIEISAMDKAENLSTKALTISIVDSTAPAIELIGEPYVQLNYDYEFVDPSVIVTDNFDENCNITVDSNVDTSKIGSYHILYTVTDSSGNQNSIERIVEICDTIAPIIKVDNSDTIELTLGEMLSDDITATDYIDGDIEIEKSGNINYLSTGNYQVTFTAEDSSGNIATETKNVIINPLIATSASGITTTFFDFTITTEGVYYTENTVLSMTVELENTTDHKIEYYSRFNFSSDKLNKQDFNLAMILSHSIIELDAKEKTTDHFDIAYSGDANDFYAATEMDFDTVLTCYEVPLKNKYDICFQELQDNSMTN